MFPIASTTAILSQAFTDTGTILLLVLGVVVTAAISLVGLGFGWRQLKGKITGKKF